MKALVVGGAACVWDDLAAAQALGEYDVVAAVNDVGAKLDRLDFWCSLHPDKFPRWMKARGSSDNIELWAHTKAGKLPLHVIDDWGGSSGLFAVRVLLEKGFTRIVLCGVPMEPTAHFFDTRAWVDCVSYRAAWQRRQPFLSRYVRSMSGWTRDLLGEPSSDWLETIQPDGL